MRASLFLISLALSSAACSDAREYEEKAGVAATPAASGTEDAQSAANTKIETETEQYIFSYQWPAAAAAHADLLKVLRADADAMQQSLADEAAQDWEGAQGQDWTPRQHSASLEWKVVADLPGYLSMSGSLATYSGGAHGMYGLQSMVWDKTARSSIDAREMFASPTQLETALGARLCETLNREREKRRGMEIDPESTDSFDTCPGVDEATVLVGSSNGETFDRIAIYFGPYVAGAYAEGDYELNFPVTAAVLDAVKPEYASAFSIKR